MIASTTVSATHMIASTTVNASNSANICTILWTILSKIELKDIFSAIAALLTALIGAFTGAWFAFKLQDEANKRKEIKSRITAGNKTMFALVRQCSELKLIQQEQIEPTRLHPIRLVTLPAIPPLINVNLKYDFDNLNFLFETKHRGYMMNYLYQAEYRFQRTAWLVRKRSNFHYQTAQPLLAKAGFQGQETLVEIQEILGYKNTVELTEDTNSMVSYIDSTIIFLDEANNKLYTALKDLYPEEDGIINFEPIDKKSN